MKKILFIIAATYILGGCTKHSDPMQNIEFGKIPKKRFLKDMVVNGTFTVFQDDKKTNDTTSIGYILKGENVEIPMRVRFNEEFISDRYTFGSLRRIHLRLGDDVEEYGTIYRSSGKIEKTKIDNLYKTFVEWYGEPDSLSVKNEYDYDSFSEVSDAFISGKDNPNKIDKNYFPGKNVVWSTSNFNLKMQIPTLKKQSGSKVYYQQENHDAPIEIYYEMHDYAIEIKRIQDSMARSFKPNDMVKIYLGKYEFLNNPGSYNDYKFVIKFNQIHRIDREEPRRIKAVRFDLIIRDSFKKELFRREDITVELPSNSYLESHPPKGEIGQVMFADINMSFWKDFNSHSNSELAILFRYEKGNKIFLETDIKSILFEDGAVLKSQ